MTATLAGSAIGRMVANDPFNRVIHQSASQPVQRRLRIILAQRNNVAVLLLHANPARNNSIDLALRPLHRDRIALDFDRHSLRQCDRLFSNS